jgi:hypothetical protein
MKLFLPALLILSVLSASAQRKKSKRNFGITAGINEYYANPSFTSAKSGTGFSAGVLGGFKITRKSDLVVEASYMRFNMDFYGKELGPVSSGWLDFHSDRLSLSALYYYDLFNLKDNEVSIGLHAGPSITYLNNFTVKGKDNADYTLDPYDVNALWMKISRYDGGISFNAFAAIGASVRYNDVELNVRYYKGLNSPYRNITPGSGAITTTGTDNYMSVTFNWYFKV